MTVSEAYQNGYTAKLGLSASLFSAEFGFDVTRTLTVTDGYSYQIPAGKCARIKAYVAYQDYKGSRPPTLAWANRSISRSLNRWATGPHGW